MNESFNNKVEPYAPVENAGRFNYEQTAKGNSYRNPELERLGKLARRQAESANQTTESPRVDYIEELNNPKPEKPLTPEQKIAATGQRVIGLRDKYDGDYAEYLKGFGLAAEIMVKRVLTKTLKLLVGDDLSLGLPKLRKKRPLKKLSERELLALESEIGSELFGEIPKGHRREFFCLDEKTWMWHEEWIDAKHKLKTHTIKYEVTDRGILKTQPGPRYSYLEGDELRNFSIATQMYYEQVARQVYKRDPETGEKLV